jgi:hypothetical protein
MALLSGAKRMIGLNRLFVLSSLFLAVVLLTANVTAMVVGTAQPEHPVLAGFNQGCHLMPQPCWNGIVPGLTKAAEQIHIMQDSGYIPEVVDGLVAWYRSPSGSSTHCERVIFIRTRTGEDELIIHEIILSRCPNMQSGDVMRLFRRPSILSSATPILLYGDGTVRAIFRQSSRWHTSSFEPVEDLRLRASMTLQLHDWHGFLMPWRYCQFEPGIPGCA